jgi:hypothetical protein
LDEKSVQEELIRFNGVFAREAKLIVSGTILPEQAREDIETIPDLSDETLRQNFDGIEMLTAAIASRSAGTPLCAQADLAMLATSVVCNRHDSSWVNKVCASRYLLPQKSLEQLERILLRIFPATPDSLVGVPDDQKREWIEKCVEFWNGARNAEIEARAAWSISVLMRSIPRMDPYDADSWMEKAVSLVASLPPQSEAYKALLPLSPHSERLESKLLGRQLLEKLSSQLKKQGSVTEEDIQQFLERLADLPQSAFQEAASDVENIAQLVASQKFAPTLQALFAVVQLASESATGEYSARALSRVCEGRTYLPRPLLEKVNLLWGNLFSFSPQEVKKLKQAQREKRLVALNKILAQSPESLEVYVRAALALGVLALAQSPLDVEEAQRWFKVALGRGRALPTSVAPELEQILITHLPSLMELPVEAQKLYRDLARGLPGCCQEGLEANSLEACGALGVAVADVALGNLLSIPFTLPKVYRYSSDFSGDTLRDFMILERSILPVGPFEISKADLALVHNVLYGFWIELDRYDERLRKRIRACIRAVGNSFWLGRNPDSKVLQKSLSRAAAQPQG